MRELDVINNQYILGYCDMLCRPSIEFNTIWEPIKKKRDEKIVT